MKPSFEESYVQLQQHRYIWGWLRTCSKTLAGLIPQEEPTKNSPSPHLLQPRKAHKHLNHTCPTKAVQPYAERTEMKHHYAIFWYYFCEFSTEKVPDRHALKTQILCLSWELMQREQQQNLYILFSSLPACQGWNDWQRSKMRNTYKLLILH